MASLPIYLEEQQLTVDQLQQVASLLARMSKRETTGKRDHVLIGVIRCYDVGHLRRNFAFLSTHLVYILTFIFRVGSILTGKIVDILPDNNCCP
jgi:hypothetical protein